MPPNMEVWTEDRTAELRHLQAKGLSAAQIGVEMKLTRNTICGKVHRLKMESNAPKLSDAAMEFRRLERRRKETERKRLRRRTVSESKPPVERPVIAPFTGSLEIPFADLREFRTSQSNECRHIAAEPPGPNYLACGNPTEPGLSYCNHHKGINYVRPFSLSDLERQRRQATRNWNAAVVKQAGCAEAAV